MELGNLETGLMSNGLLWNWKFMAWTSEASASGSKTLKATLPSEEVNRKSAMKYSNFFIVFWMTQQDFYSTLLYFFYLAR